MDPEEAAEWIERNDHLIHWDQFEAWIEDVRGEPGYEWVDEALEIQRRKDEGWDEDDEEEFDWDVVARHIDEKKYDITAEAAAAWLYKNEDKIDWDDFEEWYDEVEDEEGYEWVDDALEEYENMDEFDMARAEARRERNQNRRNRKNRNGKGRNRDRDGRFNELDRFDEEVDEFGPERGHKRIPLWAACALTGLAVTVLALFIGLCCLYKQHKKVMEQA